MQHGWSTAPNRHCDRAKLPHFRRPFRRLMRESNSTVLLQAIGIQALAAVVVLVSNAALLTIYGGAAYQQLATLLSILVAANYLDFGYLGKVRIAAASSLLEPEERRLLTGRLFWAFSTRVAVFEIALLAGRLLPGQRSRLVDEIMAVIAVAPLVVHVNAFRAFLEGRGRIVAASVVRGGCGVLLGLSPFFAATALGDVFKFEWVVAVAALIVTVAFFAAAIGVSGFRGQSSVRPTLPRAGTITALETTYVLAGAVFLYGDRFVLLALENSARAGTYVFVVELVSRLSLVYVPLVMQLFPRLVALAERDAPAGHALLAKLDRRVLTVVGSIVLAGVCAGAALAPFLPGPVDWRVAAMLAVPLGIAYTLNASTFVHQRYTVIAHDRPRTILAGYVPLLALVALSFALLYPVLGVVGLAVTFLVRAAAENALMRWIVRTHVLRTRSGR